MFNTGTPIMDALNEEFGDVPFTITITADAVPEDRSDWFTEDQGQLPLLGNASSWKFSSSFPEEWLDWSSHSDGAPVVSKQPEPTEVEVFEQQTLADIDEFIEEMESLEEAERQAGQPVIITLSPTQTVDDMVQASLKKKDHEFRQTIAYNNRKIELAGFTLPEGLPEIDDYKEMRDHEPEDTDTTAKWIRTIENTTPESMRAVIDKMSMEDYQEFMDTCEAFGVKVPGAALLDVETKTIPIVMPPQPKSAAKRKKA